MTRLNRKVEYALMALKVMLEKKPGEVTSTKEIVERTGCPFDATARVLQKMTQIEILRSEQGAFGGYVLIRDLNRISLLELMEHLLGPLALSRCLHHARDCELLSTCNIVSPITILNRKLIDFYKQLTVGELLKSRNRERVAEVQA